MKKLLCISMIIMAFLLVVSCGTTGSTSGTGTDAGQESPSAASAEERVLEQIYDRHEGGIILTGAKTYTVVSGDTLSKIAVANYGTRENGYYFPLIIAASNNSASILDPDSIEVGMQLIIPNLQANLDNPQARTNLKSLLKDVADFYAKKGGALSEGLRAGITNLYNAL